VARRALRSPALLGGAIAARFPALRHPDFRRYVLGQSVSLSGFWMQSVAQAWLVYRISGSELALGTVAFVAYLPVLCLAPVAGVVADRVDKWRFIIGTQSAAMVLALLLGTLVAAGWGTVPLVAVFAGALGTVGAFDLPTRQSFIVEMVGPDDLPSAIALNASIFNTARVVGPALAGVLVATVGEAPCFFLNGASYLAVLWALAGMRLDARRPPIARHASRALRAGLRYVRRQPAQAALLLALGLVSALGLQANVLMPSLAQRSFGRGPTGYGLLLTGYGVGAVVSALWLASRRATREEHRRTLLGGLAIFGIGLLGVAASPSFPAAIACQTVAGLGMIRFTATTNTLIQLLVDDDYRGRVMGLHTVMFMGMAPVGSLLLGAIAEPFGARAALVISAAAPLTALAFLARRLPAAPSGVQAWPVGR
jgi:MFS family permease